MTTGAGRVDLAAAVVADGAATRARALVSRPMAFTLTWTLLAALVVAVCVRRLLAGLDPAGNPLAGLVFAVLLTVAAVAAPRFVPGLRWTWFGDPGNEPDTAGGRTDIRTGLRRPVLRSRAVRQLGLGLAAAGVLCLGPLTRHLADPGGALDLAAFPVWAAVVTTVALSEEAFLRGALWQAAAAWRGDLVALLLTTVAFALLHVPFYGWGIIPLDLAVGLLFGGLRMVGGGIAAPAAAHLVADIAGWWLR